MADGFGNPIHDRFDLLRVMRVAVIVMMSVMGVPDHMGVDMSVAMIVDKVVCFASSISDSFPFSVSFYYT